MMPYALKRMYFAVAKPLLAISGTTYRLLRSPPTGNQAVVRVQLGPGQRNYLDGWVNVDANMFTGRCDVWTDISRRLPFRDESVDAVYSHHVIEHLPDLWGHFREVFRILKPGAWFAWEAPTVTQRCGSMSRGTRRGLATIPIRGSRSVAGLRTLCSAAASTSRFSRPRISRRSLPRSVSWTSPRELRRLRAVFRISLMRPFSGRSRSRLPTAAYARDRGSETQSVNDRLDGQKNGAVFIDRLT